MVYWDSATPITVLQDLYFDPETTVFDKISVLLEFHRRHTSVGSSIYGSYLVEVSHVALPGACDQCSPLCVGIASGMDRNALSFRWLFFRELIRHQLDRPRPLMDASIVGCRYNFDLSGLISTRWRWESSVDHFDPAQLDVVHRFRNSICVDIGRHVNFRGDLPLADNIFFYELEILCPINYVPCRVVDPQDINWQYDSIVRQYSIGLIQRIYRSETNVSFSIPYVLSDTGVESRRHSRYCRPLRVGDIVGVIYDAYEGTLRFVLNGRNLGVAISGIRLQPLGRRFPYVSVTSGVMAFSTRERRVLSRFDVGFGGGLQARCRSAILDRMTPFDYSGSDSERHAFRERVQALSMLPAKMRAYLLLDL